MEKKNNSYAYRKFESLCKERNIKPYQVSKGTDGKISTAVLSQWGHNDYNLKIEKLALIANFFGIPVTDFIEQGAKTEIR